MKPIPITPETLRVAGNIIWFESAEQALADPIRFMAYAMAYALPEDMRLIRQHVSDDDFRDALDRAPPGIIDPRSWAYWNSKMGRYPAPPLPTRRFGTEADPEPAGMAGRVNPEERRKQAVKAWLRMREGQPARPSPKEMQRQAAQEWREKYGPGKKT